MHYATLHTGEDVVVKIQRPGIRRRVAADLQILKRGARIVEFAKLGQRLSAQDVVADFADNLAEELDFRLEAQEAYLMAEITRPASCRRSTWRSATRRKPI